MSEAVTINGGITVNVYPRGSMPAQQEARTLEWNDDVCEDEVTFEEAEKAVAKLGNGWRMPTRQELESCLDLNRHDPAVDPEMHPDVTSAWYWTATKFRGLRGHVWAVDFHDGNVSGDHRDNHARVRAVRSVSQAA